MHAWARMEVNGKFECQVKLGVIGALAWRNLHAICPSNLLQPRPKVYLALHGVYLALHGVYLDLGFKKYRRRARNNVSLHNET
jgi:hypothetical protein